MSLQRGARRRAVGLGHRDVLAGHPGSGATGSGDGALVAEELDHLAAGIDQGDAVVRAVLEAVGRVVDHRDGGAAAAGGGAGRHRVVGPDRSSPAVATTSIASPTSPAGVLSS
ncbi:hypothetical protein G6F22_017525 [Rhizopus arrhizus]|nr:hypothetical protein G6F22_017525 [Rhizopus arrhizus]